MEKIDIVLQYPVVITSKLDVCKEFYMQYFGFEIVFEADWYVQLKHKSGVELGFMKPNLDNQPQFLHDEYRGKGTLITFDVTDAQKEYKKVTEINGIKIIYPYTEEEWGQKHFMLEDPAGMCVDIVEQAKNA